MAQQAEEQAQAPPRDGAGRRALAALSLTAALALAACSRPAPPVPGSSPPSVVARSGAQIAGIRG